jgi:electron transport complex protein RnfA
MIYLAALAVFSGLSLNLILQFALGASAVASGKVQRELPVFQFFVFFISVLFLWFLYSYFLPYNLKGFSEYFLLFPLSALACMGFELLLERIFPQLFPRLFSLIFSKQKSPVKIFSAFTAYEGLVFVSLLITLHLADNFSAALVLVLFFVFGSLVAMLVLNEIRRRSTLEWVPNYLRGSPLLLISMGLLSLISASVAGICFRILETLP